MKLQQSEECNRIEIIKVSHSIMKNSFSKLKENESTEIRIMKNNNLQLNLQIEKVIH